MGQYVTTGVTKRFTSTYAGLLRLEQVTIHDANTNIAFSARFTQKN
jgi:hypothetical protein